MDNIAILKNKLRLVRQLRGKNLDTCVKTYSIPPLYFLKDYVQEIPKEPLKPIDLETKISEFGFECAVDHISRGPLITRYEIRLAKGVRLQAVKNIAEDLAVALMNKHIRILAPIPGTSLIGIEIANHRSSVIGFKDIIETFDGKMRLPIVMGTNTVGKPCIVDLTKMPHLLIAGQTGSGKSVFLNTLILSLIYTKRPEEVRLALVDPKRVEMASYKNIPHLIRPIVTESEDALELFSYLIEEMENRYTRLSSAGVRNIESYNESHPKMPYIVAIVDEMADLMMTASKDLEPMIVRLAQLSRAVGIHLVLATQKPTVKVITGLIKSNMPSRISFEVASKTDSRVILDCNGAESLIGKGDMLMQCPGSSEPERYHGAWVSDGEIAAVTKFIGGYSE